MSLYPYSVMDIIKTTSDGTEIFYSRADLIAAGCLVPVPDGEACDIWKCDSLFMQYGNTIYTRPNEDIGGDGWWTSIVDGSEFTGHILNGLYVDGVLVQPVRLVRLEDVG